MSRWLNRFQPWGVLFLRLVLGAAMLYYGWPKVIPAGGFHHGNTLSALHRFIHEVTTLGMPYWLGYFSAFTELVGGIFLILGLFTRFFAFLVTIDMLVALVTVNLHKGLGYTLTQLSIALLAIAFMLLLSGPGAAALDRKIGFS